MWGLDSDGNVTTVRSDVVPVDGHVTMWTYDPAVKRWSKHVWGPGGAEMWVLRIDVPRAVRCAARQRGVY